METQDADYSQTTLSAIPLSQRMENQDSYEVDFYIQYIGDRASSIVRTGKVSTGPTETSDVTTQSFTDLKRLSLDLPSLSLQDCDVFWSNGEVKFCFKLSNRNNEISILRCMVKRLEMYYREEMDLLFIKGIRYRENGRVVLVRDLSENILTKTTRYEDYPPAFKVRWVNSHLQSGKVPQWNGINFNSTTQPKAVPTAITSNDVPQISMNNVPPHPPKSYPHPPPSHPHIVHALPTRPSSSPSTTSRSPHSTNSPPQSSPPAPFVFQPQRTSTASPQVSGAKASESVDPRLPNNRPTIVKPVGNGQISNNSASVATSIPPTPSKAVSLGSHSIQSPPPASSSTPLSTTAGMKRKLDQTDLAPGQQSPHLNVRPRSEGVQVTSKHGPTAPASGSLAPCLGTSSPASSSGSSAKGVERAQSCVTSPEHENLMKTLQLRLATEKATRMAEEDKHRKEVDHLKAILKMAKDDRAVAQNTLKSCEGERDTLKGQLEAAKGIREAAAKVLRGLKEEQEAHAATRASHHSEMDRLYATLAKEKESVASARNELRSRDADREKYKSSWEAEKERCGSAEARLWDSIREKERYKDAQATIQSELDKLKTTLDKLKTTLDKEKDDRISAQSMLRSCEVERDRYKFFAESVKKDRTAVENLLHEARMEKEARVSAQATLQSELDKLKTTLGKEKDDRVSAQSSLKSCEVERDKYNTLAETEKKERASVEKTLQGVRIERTELFDLLKREKDARAKCARQVEDEVAKADSLREELRVRDRNLEEYKEAVRVLENRLEDVRGEREHGGDTIERLEGRLRKEHRVNPRRVNELQGPNHELEEENTFESMWKAERERREDAELSLKEESEKVEEMLQMLEDVRANNGWVTGFMKALLKVSKLTGDVLKESGGDAYT